MHQGLSYNDLSRHEKGVVTCREEDYLNFKKYHFDDNVDFDAD